MKVTLPCTLLKSMAPFYLTLNKYLVTGRKRLRHLSCCQDNRGRRGVQPLFSTLGFGWELEGRPAAVSSKRISLLRMPSVSLERLLTSSSAFDLSKTALLA